MHLYDKYLKSLCVLGTQKTRRKKFKKNYNKYKNCVVKILCYKTGAMTLSIMTFSIMTLSMRHLA